MIKMINKSTKILIIILIIILGVVSLFRVDAIMNKHLPQATIYADLSNLDTTEMFQQMEQEDLLKQAYLKNSLYVNEEDVKLLGNVIYNEVRGSSKLDQSCVAWTVLNRCDRDGLTIRQVVSIPKQFAFKPNLKLKSDKAKAILAECEAMARDVIIRHLCEQDGLDYVGRTLPNNYYSFWGDGKTTHFRTNVGVYIYWDYHFGNPYQ